MRLRGEGQVRERLENVLQGQRERFFGWVPVSLGLGIGGYFSLPVEPDVIVMLLGGIAVLCLFVGARLVPAAFAPLLIALVLIVTGAGLAKWRVTSLDAPVLGFRYYGPIQGEVVHIDRSSSDALRLTLDGVVLARMGQGRTPQRVRVSLHGDQPYDRFHPGDTLIMTGHLAPPSGPAEPGGFDFQRHAWFMQLGGSGVYAHASVAACPT
jgi:competence protein ComEC